MTAVVATLAVVVAVLALLVAGLLRSHAVILRRLHEAGVADIDDGSLPLVPSEPDTPRPNDAPTGRAAADLSGVTPDGDPVTVAVTGRRHDTSLLFLSADCGSCQPFWEAVGDGRARSISTREHRLVVVTRGPEADLAGTIAGRPADVPVVMSTQGWTDYQVPGAPYIVQVDGPSGRVRGEGTSASWEQLVALAERGRTESAPRRGRARRRSQAAPRDSDEELRAVGIQPGDPSLYPEDEGDGTEHP